MACVLIPLSTNRPLRRPTIVTIALIVANIAVYGTGRVLAEADPDAAKSLTELMALKPYAFRWWGLISYAFVHAGLWHVLGNMIFLWVFGPNVEDRFGRIGFLVFYLLGGAAAGGFHVAFEHAWVIGASGAVAAVTGAYLVLFPRTTIRTLFIVFIGVFDIPAWWFIGGRIAWDLFATGSGLSGNVATGAHLAGYTFGAAVSLILLWTKLLPREMYDLFSISRQAARRRQFKEVQFQQQRPAAKPGLDEAKAEELARLRADVLDRLASGDAPALAAAYRRLLDAFGEESSILSRKAQYDAANMLLRSGEHQTAATAYRLFLKGYPNDSEVPQVRLMMGLINARYLNDPVQAKRDVTDALPGLKSEPEQELAKELLSELG